MPDSSENHLGNSVSMDYLLECYRSAREEVLFRVRHRDDWLKLQLLAQAALLALARGIELAGLRAAKPYPDITSFSIAISLIFTCLYYTEDNLIGYLGIYIGAISKAEAELNGGHRLIESWDTSEPLRQYARYTLPSRFLAQLVAFMVIPAGLTVLRFTQITHWGLLEWSEVIVDTALWIIIGILCFRGFMFRRKSGHPHSVSILTVSSNQEGTAPPIGLFKKLKKAVEIVRG